MHSLMQTQIFCFYISLVILAPITLFTYFIKYLPQANDNFDNRCRIITKTIISQNRQDYIGTTSKYIHKI